ncbi:hypothetical protein BDY24DRAFT_104885 [Mrakia frigida]|uniref:uncharacterized protein n=1 Tax=Mrakia frigida TaxID=29902 RepID=UPI003FCC18B0
MPPSSKPSSTSSSRVPPRAPPLPPSTSSSSSASATAASKNIALVSTLLQGLTEEDFDLAPSSSQSSQPQKKPLSTSSSSKLNSSQQPSRLPPAPAALVDEYSSLFDDFPIDDDWEADLLQPAPTKVKQQPELESPLLILNPPPTAPPMEWSPRAWVRCTVSKVEDGGRDGNGWGRKRVLVTTHRTNHPLSLRLEGEYAELPISPADILNIISPDLPSFVHSSSASPSVTIKLENADPCFTNDVLLRNDSTSTTASSNDEPTTTTVNEIVFSTSHPENFIIFHPDLLLPNTTISTSLSCPRKSVMSGLVKTR